MFEPKQSRGYLLPKGCKDLGDVLKAKAAMNWKASKPKPLKTNEQIREVLQKFIPELSDGTIEIVSMARIVGRRCLLVVRPTITTTDLSGGLTSLGPGSRLDALAAELGDESLSVRRWNPTTEDFIRQCFRVPEFRIAILLAEKAAMVTLNKRAFDDAHSRYSGITRAFLLLHSEMVQLVSEVTGWKISLETSSD